MCQVALEGKGIHCLFRGQSKVMWCYCSLFSLRCLKCRSINWIPTEWCKPLKDWLKPLIVSQAVTKCCLLFLCSGIAKHVCIHYGINTGCGCATVASFFKFDLSVFRGMTKMVLMQKTAFKKVNSRSFYSTVYFFQVSS